MRESAKKSDIGLDIGDRPRIHGQKVQRMLQKFGDGLLFVRNGANYERRFQPQDVLDGFHVPAVPQFWEIADGSDVGAPSRDPDDGFPRADRAQDGCRAGRKRNDTQRCSSRGLHGFWKRIAEAMASRRRTGLV